MCIDFRRADVRVAEHCLHSTEVCAVNQEVCREGVAECVWGDLAPHPGVSYVGLESCPEILSRHGGAADCEEHRLRRVGSRAQILLNGSFGLVPVWHQPVFTALSSHDYPAVMPLVSS